LGFPRQYGPLIEHAVEDAILHADARRLAVARVIGPPMWAGFRRHHVRLDGCWEYRRKRYLIWRAAAL
jgi:hypothetical protein